MTLDLALITHSPAGIGRIADMKLPRIDGVRYVISWQNHGGAPIPESLMRDDMDIHRFDLTGLSANRNNSLDHCSADIVLLADDDLIYTPAQIKSVIDTFADNPDVDLATFMVDMHGAPVYPPATCALSEPLPKGYWALSVSIAFRRRAIGDLRFHPMLGLGSPSLHGAEDALFLLAAIRRKLRCRFFPVVICSHPHQSTGTKSAFNPGNLRAAGCYMAIAHPFSYMPRIIVKAWRVSRLRQAGFLNAARYLAEGARSAAEVLRSDRRYLW